MPFDPELNRALPIVLVLVLAGAWEAITGWRRHGHQARDDRHWRAIARGLRTAPRHGPAMVYLIGRAYEIGRGREAEEILDWRDHWAAETEAATNDGGRNPWP